MADTHTVMKKSLAKALMDAGMEHFDAGGIGGTLSGIFGGQNSFQASGPQMTSQNLTPQIGNLQDQNQQVYGQQQSLAQTLLNQANGIGPNVAQNQLNQATGTNVANQAALMAGQRGSGANAGLIAREAAQQGGNLQQQAAGQGATLGAQQQIAAQGAQTGLLNNIAQQSLQGQNIDQNAIASQNASNLNAQGLNANTAQANAKSASNAAGGLLGGAASAISSLFYKGGDVPQKFDIGGYATPSMPTSTILDNAADSPFSSIHLAQKKPVQMGTTSDSTNPLITGANNSLSAIPGSVMGGGPMDTGPVASVPLGALLAYNGGNIEPHDFRTGGPVPGKANVPGKNDPKNDTVPALLSPGEEVLPLSVTTAKDPEKAAVAFMKHLKNMKEDKDKPKGYGKVIAARKKKGA